METKFTQIIYSNVGYNEKSPKLFSLMSKAHAETQSIMKESFVNLILPNALLNAELKNQNKALEEHLNQLQEQLGVVT